MATALSINVNKIALIRNSRGESRPDVLDFSKQCLDLGADGITVHPRPDGRHIRYDDVYQLSELLSGYDQEFNVEGYPSDDFMKMVLDVKPDQVTLVPDPPEALTSSNGWDVTIHQEFLKQVISQLKDAGIRASVFLNPDLNHIKSLPNIGTDRIELYTYDYAKDPEGTISKYAETAKAVSGLGIAVNAGHNLDAKNLPYFLKHVPECVEVSIGHAFVCDCLDAGLKQTMKLYLQSANQPGR